MKAELIPLLNSDRGIATAARVSYNIDDKRYPDSKVPGLLSYLHEHKHWSPYAHARELFGIGITLEDWVHFVDHACLAGFTWRREAFGHDLLLNGSLWAWYENLQFLPNPIQVQVYEALSKRYPLSAVYLWPEPIVPSALGETGYAQHMELPDSAAAEYPNLVYVTMRITAPIFIARQMVKHQVGLTWNEVSRRYVEDTPVLWVPPYWRHRAKKNKQGSTDDAVLFSEQVGWDVTQVDMVHHYEQMLKEEIAPEDARIGLPLNTETSWVWTGHLSAFIRVLKQRLDPHAQKYTQELASEMFGELSSKFPQSFLGLWTGGPTP